MFCEAAFSPNHHRLQEIRRLGCRLRLSDIKICVDYCREMLQISNHFRDTEFIDFLIAILLLVWYSYARSRARVILTSYSFNHNDSLRAPIQEHPGWN